MLRGHRNDNGISESVTSSPSQGKCGLGHLGHKEGPWPGGENHSAAKGGRTQVSDGRILGFHGITE